MNDLHAALCPLAGGFLVCHGTVHERPAPAAARRDPRPALLVLTDGTVFEGEALGATPAGGHRHRRGRVQHRPHRLPGGHLGPLLRRPDHHLHLPPHRQLRGRPPPTTRAAARSAGASSSASWPAAAPTGARPRTSTPGSSATASPGIGGIDTRRLTRHIRDTGAMPGAFGALGAAPTARPSTRPPCWPPPWPSPAPTASTWSPRSPPTRPTRSERRAPPGRRLRLRHQDHDPAPPRRLRHRRGRPGLHPGRRGAGPRAPTASSSPTAPATPRPSPTPSTPSASCSARSRSSASASATRSSASPSAPRRSSCPFGHHGGNHPVRAPARRPRSRSPARTTTSPSPPTPSTAPRSPT